MPQGLANDGKKMEASAGEAVKEVVSSSSRVKVKKASSFRIFTDSIRLLARNKKTNDDEEDGINAAGAETDPRTEAGVKRRNSLFRRPSWRRFTNRISRFVSASSASVSSAVFPLQPHHTKRKLKHRKEQQQITGAGSSLFSNGTCDQPLPRSRQPPTFVATI